MKLYDTTLVREYIEMHLNGHREDNHLSEDEAKWFMAQLLQLEQAEALNRIADALEALLQRQEAM